MLRLFTFFFIFLTITFEWVHAQPKRDFSSSEGTNTLFIGPAAGVNLSKFKFKDQFEENETSALLGFSGGVNFGLQFNKFAILSGFHFMQKGSKYETPNDFYELDINQDTYFDYGFFSYKEKLNFLTIPLLARYQIGEDMGFLIGAGIAFNVGLNADISGTFQLLDPTLLSLVDEVNIANIYSSAILDYGFGGGLGDEYKKLQTSLILNPGFFAKIGEKGKLCINLHWDIGVGDSYNERFKDIASIFGKQTNRSIGLQISYEHHLEFGREDTH